MRNCNSQKYPDSNQRKYQKRAFFNTNPHNFFKKTGRQGYAKSNNSLNQRKHPKEKPDYLMVKNIIKTFPDVRQSFNNSKIRPLSRQKLWQKQRKGSSRN